VDLHPDDRPFGGPGPPAAVFFYSPDRRGEHPEGHLAGFAGILQADAYGGFNRLYEPDRKPGPVLEAACWAHARRKFFVLAEIGLNARRKLAESQWENRVRQAQRGPATSAPAPHGRS
jgi:transposase